MITTPAKRLRKFDQFIIGSSTRTELEYIEISPDFPWFCLSNIDQDLSTINFSTEFINKRRNLKHIYNEFNDPLLDPKTELFSGTWSNNVFTLANNAANNAMLAELAEDWLYHNSPVSNWRILSDGITEFNITGINVTSRTITVNLDSEATTGTSIEIYTNRVYRDATKARHFSEAGLATYQAGGGKSGRLFRRDQMQGHERLLQYSNAAGGATTTWVRGNAENTGNYQNSNGRGGTNLGIVDDGTNGTPRTGNETIAKSSSRYEYIFVGSYTA